MQLAIEPIVVYHLSSWQLIIFSFDYNLPIILYIKHYDYINCFSSCHNNTLLKLKQSKSLVSIYIIQKILLFKYDNSLIFFNDWNPLEKCFEKFVSNTHKTHGKGWVEKIILTFNKDYMALIVVFRKVYLSFKTTCVSFLKYSSGDMI